MSKNGKRVLPELSAITSSVSSLPHQRSNQTSEQSTLLQEELVNTLASSLARSGPGEKSAVQNKYQYDFEANDYYDKDGLLYSVDDEEIDEPPVPIPSTWQTQSTEETNEKSQLTEQIRSSAYGFLIGFIVVICIMYFFTGYQSERLSPLQEVTLQTNKTSQSIVWNNSLASPNVNENMHISE